MNLLKKRRKELNLTQKEVATELGISWQAYQRYETNKVTPTVYMALKIANALNTAVEDIFIKD